MEDGGCRLRFVYIQQGYEVIDLKASPLNSNKENRPMLSEQRISSMCFMMSNVAFWKLTVVSAACSELKVICKTWQLLIQSFIICSCPRHGNVHLMRTVQLWPFCMCWCWPQRKKGILNLGYPPSSLVVRLLKKELTIQVTCVMKLAR